jgi:CRISPR-associated protein Cas1
LNSAIDASTIDEVWAARSEMWRNRLERTSSRRSKRARGPLALTLAGNGVSLRVEGDSLTIRNGFTRYPQKQETYRYFKGDSGLPERIILIDGNGNISFDALSWLAEQNVALVRINWKGEIVCVSGASGYSANPYRVQWQLETRNDPFRRMDFCRSIITRKIAASIVTLERSVIRSDKWERAMKLAYAADAA